MLWNIYKPDSGAIYIGGNNIFEIDNNNLRNHIGLVTQDPYIFSGSLYENILYGNLNAEKDEVYEAARIANANKFIQDLPQKYDTHVGEKGITLSGGQKQMISIARVILKKPKILILDEATASVDSQSELYIQESLKNLTKNKTTIIISHRLSTLSITDKILILEKGQIKKFDYTNKVIEMDKFFSELFGNQIHLNKKTQ